MRDTFAVSQPDLPHDTVLAAKPLPIHANVLRRLVSSLPAVLALLAVCGLIVLGQRVGWKMPKFSVLTGAAAAERDDWCTEHAVPESICVECNKQCATAGGGSKSGKTTWCDAHGVPECPLCQPELAQLLTAPTVTSQQLAVASVARNFSERVENSNKCKLHERLIQFTSLQAYRNAAIAVEPVKTGNVIEAISAPATISYDPTRLARLSSRLPGAVWRVEKQVGDRVRRGDVLALIEAAEVGKAKAAFLEALLQAELKRKNLAGLQAASASVPEQSIRLARAALDETEIGLVAARQVLLNLGLPVQSESLRGLEPAEAARAAQFLGLPDALARSLDGKTTSANLWPLRAAQDGVVVSRDVATGESVDPTRVLFVVADTREMWLMLEVRLEDAFRVRQGQVVRFQADRKGPVLTARVDWVSTAVGEKTRTVSVRAAIANADARLHAATFGTAQVVQRQENNAVVVPSAAVHWEGCCHVVFVRDTQFTENPERRVFHVRKVLPGAKMEGRTEIVAGVLPGEMVATSGSGLLRSELLKNNLGAG